MRAIRAQVLRSQHTPGRMRENLQGGPLPVGIHVAFIFSGVVFINLRTSSLKPENHLRDHGHKRGVEGCYDLLVGGFNTFEKY